MLNIPAIRALKERYPQAKLTLAVNSGLCELASVVEYVDAVVVWDQIKKGLHKRKFDLCVILNPTKEAHWNSFLAGIPIRVGYDRKWGFLLTHKLKDTKYIGNRHEVDCNLELVGLVGAKIKDKSLVIKVKEGIFSELAGQKIIAIHPFTSDSVKQWPLERFRDLAQALMQEPGVKVAIIGASDEKIDFAEGVINMINQTSLVELAVFLKRSSLLISGDSGPVHLAAAVGTPVVALFRNDLLGKTAKRWGPWGVGHIVIEKNSLSDISVNEVVEQVKKLALR